MKRSKAIKQRTDASRAAWMRRRQKAWQAGYDCCYSGGSLDDNPHMHWTECRNDWEAGYFHAYREIGEQDQAGA